MHFPMGRPHGATTLTFGGNVCCVGLFGHNGTQHVLLQPSPKHISTSTHIACLHVFAGLCKDCKENCSRAFSAMMCSWKAHTCMAAFTALGGDVLGRVAADGPSQKVINSFMQSFGKLEIVMQKPPALALQVPLKIVEIGSRLLKDISEASGQAFAAKAHDVLVELQDIAGAAPGGVRWSDTYDGPNDINKLLDFAKASILMFPIKNITAKRSQLMEVISP